MPATRLFSSSFLGFALGALLLVFGAIVLTTRFSPGDESGQVWRRGLIGGEQVVLRGDGSYAMQLRGWFGALETHEVGVWRQLGDAVSLVPSTPGRKSRLMRRLAEHGNQYLFEPVAGSARPPRDTWFERID